MTASHCFNFPSLHSHTLLSSLIPRFESLLSYLFFSCPIFVLPSSTSLSYLGPCVHITTDSPSWDLHETILHSAYLHITCIFPELGQCLHVFS